MNNKGFTLVELLAAIAIVALLGFLSTNTVTQVVKNSKSDLYQTQLELIKVTAESWASDNLDKLPANDQCSYLTLRNLKDYGLLKEEVINPKTNKSFPDDMKIKISSKINESGNLKTTYEVDAKNVNGCTSVYSTICTTVTEETKTTGNIPEGKYNPGDEYICEVSPGTSYHFFVLSKDVSNVNLIMYANINSSGIPVDSNDLEDKGGVLWINQTDYNDDLTWDGANNTKGPITALKYLQTATSLWSNIPNIQIDYINEADYPGDYGYGSIKTEDSITTITMKDGTKVTDIYGTELTYTNLKARLPYPSEVRFADYESPDDLWLLDYLENSIAMDGRTNVNGVRAYWTLYADTRTASSGGITYVGYNPIIYTASADGIRPVISIPKYNMS